MPGESGRKKDTDRVCRIPFVCISRNKTKKKKNENKIWEIVAFTTLFQSQIGMTSIPYLFKPKFLSFVINLFSCHGLEFFQSHTFMGIVLDDGFIY